MLSDSALENPLQAWTETEEEVVSAFQDPCHWCILENTAEPSKGWQFQPEPGECHTT